MHAPQQILGPDGGGADLYVIGTLAYSAMLLAMLFKAGTNTYTWTGVSWFFFLGSLLLYLIFLLGYGALPVFAVFAGGFFQAPYHMLATPAFWLLMLLVPAVSVHTGVGDDGGLLGSIDDAHHPASHHLINQPHEIPHTYVGGT